MSEQYRIPSVKLSIASTFLPQNGWGTKPSFIYHTNEDTKEECIIMSSNYSIYEYNIKFNNYSKITDVHSKEKGTEIMHLLYNPHKKYLYRLFDNYNILIYSLNKNKWIGYFESNIKYYPNSCSLYVPKPFNYIYLVTYDETNDELLQSYRYNFKTKTFVTIHNLKKLSLSVKSVLGLVWMQSMQQLILIIKGKELIEIYEIINDEWSKMMQFTYKENHYNRTYAFCTFRHYIMINLGKLHFIDLKAKELYDAYPNEILLGLNPEYIVKTKDDKIHLFEWSRSQFHGTYNGQFHGNHKHINVNLLDLLPSKIIQKLYKIHKVVIPQYVKQMETLYDFVFPQSLQQLIMSYTPLLL